MRNFKLWFENSESNPIIFLDLDETLISTLKLPSNTKNVDELISLGGIPVDDSYISFLRPHANEFINKMKSIAKTCILTAGSRAFQTKAIKALNIPIEDNHIFCIEDYDLDFIRPKDNKLPKNKNSVLVDDLDYTAGKTMAKLYAIGIDEDRHIKVNPFNFNPILARKLPRFYKNDDELLNIESAVINILKGKS